MRAWDTRPCSSLLLCPTQPSTYHLPSARVQSLFTHRGSTLPIDVYLFWMQLSDLAIAWKNQLGRGSDPTAWFVSKQNALVCYHVRNAWIAIVPAVVPFNPPFYSRQYHLLYVSSWNVFWVFWYLETVCYTKSATLKHPIKFIWTVQNGRFLNDVLMS